MILHFLFIKRRVLKKITHADVSIAEDSFFFEFQLLLSDSIDFAVYTIDFSIVPTGLIVRTCSFSGHQKSSSVSPKYCVVH